MSQHQKKEIDRSSPKSGLHSSSLPLPFNEEKLSKFLKKVQYFLHQSQKKFPGLVTLTPNSKGFYISNEKQKIEMINKLIQELFSIPYETFNYQLKKAGFKIKDIFKRSKIGKKEAIKIFKFDTVIDDISSVKNEEQEIIDSSEQQHLQQNDGFPRQEQMQSILQQKYPKNPINNLKYHVSINNKIQSEKVISRGEMSKEIEDISIEAKLRENAASPTNQIKQNLEFLSKELNYPGLISENEQKGQGKEVISSQLLIEKSEECKQNYLRCSNLIETTIFKILNAHKQRSIQQKGDEILNNITEIYDLISQNVENIQSTTKNLIREQISQIKQNEHSQQAQENQNPNKDHIFK